MEVRISSIVRNIFTQRNFSTVTKDPNDYVKNRGIFNTVIFIRTSWQIFPTPLQLPCRFVNLTEVTTSCVRSTFKRWILPI
ncbi:unnamed protein product [Hymenolepis diminuta]|uniref:Uncharacterized protein n=1 Tax=Hymenolepis diminuta TaxID=6216 RepID=A0A564Z2F0_HYMDI|nr:unnamed protein product [Hymenolepis diminuta]